MLADPLSTQSTSRNCGHRLSYRNRQRMRHSSANKTRRVATASDIPAESTDRQRLAMHNVYDSKREFELHGSQDYL